MTRLAGVILVDADGAILLQERDEFPAIDPLKWSLAGGHLDPGEEFEAGALRELAEETGIRPEPGDLRLWREFSWTDPGGAVEMAVYVGRTTLTDADIVLGEGRQIVFVAPDRARTLDLGGAASEIVPAFLDSATYRALTGTRPASPGA